MLTVVETLLIRGSKNMRANIRNKKKFRSIPINYTNYLVNYKVKRDEILILPNDMSSRVLIMKTLMAFFI